MEKLPVLKPQEVESALIRAGFYLARKKGSHRIYTKEETSNNIKTKTGVTVPFHKGKDIKRPTLKSILKQADLTPEEFRELL